MNLREKISKLVKKVKTNYNYFKIGRKLEFDEQQKAYRDRIMNTNKKEGVYDPVKERMIKEKLKKGEPI